MTTFPVTEFISTSPLHHYDRVFGVFGPDHPRPSPHTLQRQNQQVRNFK